MSPKHEPVFAALLLGAQGPNVLHHQSALNLRLRAHGDPLVTADGQLDPETVTNTAYAAWFLGASDRSVDEVSAGVISVEVQHLVSTPNDRDLDQLARAAARRDQHFLSLGERAYRVASGLVGVTEEGDADRGEIVDAIVRAAGSHGPEAWCGDVVRYAYLLAGSTATSRDWVNVKTGGDDPDLHPVSEPRRGDLVRFTFPNTRTTFDHVGIFERDLGGGTILSVEGNTGGDASSDAPVGEGVRRKRRGINLVRDYLRVAR